MSKPASRRTRPAASAGAHAQAAPAQAPQPGGRYHHGDLRNALVQAGLALLEEKGPEEISLRALAQAVGVSHAAPAHHFGSMKGLWTALAAQGYARFATALRAARLAAGPDAPAQLRATGDAYLAFARTHPNLFRLMFTHTLLDWSQPDLQQKAGAARHELSELSGPAADHLGLKDPTARQGLEHTIWACAHGFARLHIDGAFTGADQPLSDAAWPRPDLADLIFASAASGRLRTG